MSGLAAGHGARPCRQEDHLRRENSGSIGGDSATSCFFMFASGTQACSSTPATPPPSTRPGKASPRTQTAGWEQYEWFPEWAKGKYYANTKFIDTAISDFGVTIQEPSTEEELPRLNASVILPGEGIGTGGESTCSRPSQAEARGAGRRSSCTACRATALIKDAPDGAVIGCRFEDTEKGALTSTSRPRPRSWPPAASPTTARWCSDYIPDWANYRRSSCMAAWARATSMGVAAGAAAGRHGLRHRPTYCNLMGDIPNCHHVGLLDARRCWCCRTASASSRRTSLTTPPSPPWRPATASGGSIFDQKAFDARCIAASVESNINDARRRLS